MTRPAILAALALAGALVTGAAAGYAYGTRRGPFTTGVRAARSVNAAVLFLNSETLLDSLRLSPGQREHIDRVLGAGSSEADSILVRMRDDFRRITRSARDAIRDTLTAGQRSRFDSLLAEALPVRPRVPAGIGQPPPAGRDTATLQRQREPRP